MTLTEILGAVGASFAACLGASMLPIGGGSEAYVIATSVLLDNQYFVPIVAASAGGSVAAKSIVYLATSHAFKLPGVVKEKTSTTMVEKVSHLVEHAKERIERGPWIRRGVIVSAALVSMPPFYVAAVAAGALKTSLREFILLAYAAQLVHFGLVWFVPGLFTG